MACDICGDNSKTLVDLREEYKTSQVAQICPACEKVINDQLWKLRAVSHNITKSLLIRFMEVLHLKGKKGEQNG